MLALNMMQGFQISGQSTWGWIVWDVGNTHPVVFFVTLLKFMWFVNFLLCHPIIPKLLAILNHKPDQGIKEIWDRS